MSIKSTNFNFKGQTKFYKGKVRDVYYFGENILMIASDRISAFDVILPEAIPFKGQVLNQLAAKFLNATKDIIPNWLTAVPDANASFGLNCNSIPIEVVVRGYLVGHAWRTYNSGKRVLCGVNLPEGMVENQKFQSPIITPSTKAQEGHDMDISKQEILDQKIIDKELYEKIERIALELFERGSKMAEDQGLLLVDTKYEFGLYNNQLYLIDEVHTPDSSRYFYKDSYVTNLKNGTSQKQLSKEFVREWLIKNEFQGKEGQRIPEMTEEKVKEISDRYIELYEKVSGETFNPDLSQEPLKRIQNNINKYLDEL